MTDKATEQQEEELERRADDRFLRRVVWLLIASLIASVSGFFILYGDVQSNKMALEKYASDYKTMVDIKVLVAQLVENSEARNEKLNQTNELLKKYSETQQYIFGEQKRRRPLIDSVLPHIRNRSVHK